MSANKDSAGLESKRSDLPQAAIKPTDSDSDNLSKIFNSLLPLSLLTASSLILEIALTRVIATLYYPPYVFAVLSLAILGLGLGAALAAWRPAWRAQRLIPRYLWLTSFCTLILYSAILTPSLHNGLLFLLPLPYLLIGLTLATWFSHHPTDSPRLYCADLLGAGLGVLLAIPLLNLLGGLDTLLLASLGFGLVGMMSSPPLEAGSLSSPENSLPVARQPSPVQLYDRMGAKGAGLEKLPPLGGFRGADSQKEARLDEAKSELTSPDPLGGTSYASGEVDSLSRVPIWGKLRLLLWNAFLLTLLLANQLGGWLTLDVAHLPTDKPLRQAVRDGGEVLATRWDAFARTDLVAPSGERVASDIDRLSPRQPYQIYLDGAAGSVMPIADDLSLLRTDIGFFPFATRQPQRVLIIGAGGGLEVWFAQRANAESIVAVELNQASVDLVRQFAAINGDLYGQSAVTVWVDEGRSRLRRLATEYEMIVLSQVVTLSAERGGYVLTENSVYTVEAFVDYLRHLTDGGVIALKLYDELTLTRALVSAATALKQTRPISDDLALSHLAAYLDRTASPPIPLLLVQSQPYRPSAAIAEATVARRVGFVPLFVPHVTAPPQLDDIANGQTTLAELVDSNEADISPTTDNRPFFYHFERDLPRTLRLLLGSLSVVVLLGFVALIRHQRPIHEPFVRYSPLYFAALGVGFITVEIGLMQQTRLFLGHPTLATTTILAVLLIGGGIGSGLSAAFDTLRQRWLSLSKLNFFISLLVIVWLMLWPILSDRFFASSQFIRIAIVVLTLTPLAILMGLPFPLGLSRLSHREPQIALAWAVNGVMTVLGAAVAVGVAMSIGFDGVLLVGVGAYCVAAVVAWLR